eukprot:347399-Chlamydomonas_euryale.AAC.1
MRSVANDVACWEPMTMDGGLYNMWPPRCGCRRACKSPSVGTVLSKVPTPPPLPPPRAARSPSRPRARHGFAAT